MAQQLEDSDVLAGTKHDGPQGREHHVSVEPSPRWVRGYIDGVPVVDSRHVLLVKEPRRLAVYWFPKADIRTEFLERSKGSAETDSSIARWTLRVGDRTIENAAWSHEQPDAAHAQLRDHIAFYWNSLDNWFEEDDEVFVHPRDPYHRVDVLNSSRHIRVVVDGETVAESRRPRLLFETTLPVRYYLPKQDVRMDMLQPSETQSRCPYKGVASYWSVQVGERSHKDLVWSYPAPIPECSKIENLLCFFNEKVDTYVDGELEVRPKSPWS